MPDHGIRATISDGEVLIGNRKLLRDHGIDPSLIEDELERPENGEKTAMLVALNGRLLGIVADADTTKESVKQAVAQLCEREIDVSWMITSDTSGQPARSPSRLTSILRTSGGGTPWGQGRRRREDSVGRSACDDDR